MEKILDKFKEFCMQPYDRAVEWKDAEPNRKVIGCIPMYFPEEILHAAGVLPVTLYGSDEPITMGEHHLMNNACHQVRSTFDSLLKGKYDFLDGVAALHVCDQVRFFLEVWQLDHPFPFFHEMWRPYRLDNTNRPFLTSELKRLISHLESFTGTEITIEAIRNSIGIYNESRYMMRKLNDIRRERPGIISASDMVCTVTSSMLIPREEHNQLLRELLSRIDNVLTPEDQRFKMVIIGHLCDAPDEGLLNLIENEGLSLIDDDFITGGRYYAVDVNPDGDPIESFADYYMNMIPCTTYHYVDCWRGDSDKYSPYADYTIDMLKKGQAAGIVILRAMYCDPFDMEFVLLRERLKEENIPFLALFIEKGSGSMEAVRTRVQAFVETL